MSPSANLLPCVADAPPDVEVREMTVTDLEHGVLESLASLAEVGLTAAEAVPFFHERLRAGVRTYVACVGDEVVGTASLLVERKFIHRGGLVGHIEDVAVRRDTQRKGVGTALVRHATEEARRLGCYKVILNCLDDRVSFYTRLGFYWKDNGLRFDC
jgi:glucosamine-phosphate N-acetyltransferase